MAEAGVVRPVRLLDQLAMPLAAGKARGAAAGVRVAIVVGAGLAVVTARRGQRAELARAFETSLGLALPDGPRTVAGAGLVVIGIGVETWLAVAEAGGARALAEAGEDSGLLERRLAAASGGHATIVDQSHGLALLHLAGPDVRTMLAKGIPVDLDPRGFGPGDAAATVVAHIPVKLWRTAHEPGFALAVPRSQVGSFWHWLVEAAAPHGLEVAAG